MFSPLPSKPATRTSWCISLALHGLVLTGIVAVPLLFPETLNPRLSYNVTPLAAPIPEVQPVQVMRAPSLVPVQKRKEEPAPLRELPSREELIASIPDTPKPPIASPVKTEIPLPEPAPEKPRPLPSRTIATDVLPHEKSDTPPLNKPARQVQTGGFGDPNGVRADGRPDRPATIAQLGSFDLPAGQGIGNGTGGFRGAQGAVASAGFGNNVAAGSSSTGQRPENTTVQQGSFGDARADQAAAKVSKPSAPSATPAEILFKPIPDYTDSARKARDEGEVLLRVLFTATGEIRVLDVVKGLPHGLNESALRAAEKIRFKPATKDGRPVDSTAVVHINFQLAY